MRRTVILIDWLIPLVVLAGLTAVIYITNLDIELETGFYDADDGWPVGQQQPWSFLYHYGVVPAWVISVGALGVFLTSMFGRKFVTYRRMSLFLVLVMLVGPGIVVNDVFKKHWGRPRPKDLVAFGGEKSYAQVWQDGPAERGNSFPSGHSATAFYLFTPYFLFRRSSKRWALAFLGLGLGYGALMGIARMAQGAHFLSDVVWSAGLVYLCGLGLYYALRLHREPTRVPAAKVSN